MSGPPDSDVIWRDRGRLRTIRVRLAFGMLVPFVALMAVSAIQGFWPGGSASRLPATLVLFAAALSLPAFMAVMSRGILRHAAAIDAERTQLIELYNRARLDSMLDGLTGLGNHRAFQEELARQLEMVEHEGQALALMLIDLDDLKKVNDTRGHAAGDDLLVAVGRIAATTLRRADRAFRVGGDEFAVLMPSADLDSAMVVARRILSAAIGGDQTAQGDGFSVSIGVTAVPNPTSDARQLYANADAALYWCKRHGRTSATAYDPGLHGAGGDDRSAPELTAAVETILSTRAIRPVFQPIFSMTTGEPVGYEGLVRPTDSAAFPNAGAMFAAAEVADRIVELDFACLETVAGGVGPLEPGVYISVNLSPRTIESQMFRSGELKAIFHRNGISLDQVVLELTEREEVHDLDQLRRNLDACRRAGMRIAADDVGAGNAGLRLLSEMRFDIVKIDLSLVQGGALHDPSHAVLVAIRELADRWKASVVAEGVETAEQLAVVRSMGIASGQGYLLGRPAATRDAIELDLDALAATAPAADTPPELRVFTRPLSKSA
ncbi:MAG TPA: EAL domain-containing protein [Candidatus Limnocylindrales bacterium]|nr:EAL domain-containing protein [Candidatus Limnocylindrales bacterium]